MTKPNAMPKLSGKTGVHAKIPRLTGGSTGCNQKTKRPHLNSAGFGINQLSVMTGHAVPWDARKEGKLPDLNKQLEAVAI